MDNLSGKTIKSYEVGDLVGMGGFGAVYKAHQSVVEREVAIKIIWPAFANHPNFIRRFETEAQVVAGLEHPYIVPLYDYWREPDGAYIVMRWLRGGALRDAMDGRKWELDEVLRLIGQVSAALTLAHRYGVVHRDLKPENILLDEDGNAYLADFGIAQILSNAQDEDEFSNMGSPAYAAPEQITSDPTSPQTDIFSLGLIVYELLAGEHPFPELSTLSQTQLVYTRTTKPLPSLRNMRPELPASIDGIIQKATAIHLQDRYPDALSFARDFREATNGMESAYAKRDVIRATALDQEVIPNPYRGLRAFQEADAGNFFGRDSLVNRLVARLREADDYSRFLAVVGPSGSGKSSVVKAGLIPALRGGKLSGAENWFYADMVPGTQPFIELESALISVASDPPENMAKRLLAEPNALVELVNEILPDDKSQLFLFIDQFEEIFTLLDNEDMTNQLLELIYVSITHPQSRLVVVITIRADFYDRPLLRAQISDLMRERTEVVIPLATEELEACIVEPARRVGIDIEPSLVGAIISEIREQPGALPLLQYSLSELFERRVGNIITQDAYKRIGGVKGALAGRADELYEMFSKHQKEATRQLFLRLITLGEGTEDTRRRALLSEINAMVGTGEHVRSVIDILGASRLLTFDRDPVTRSPTVEVTHEAIIREWSRLREWLDDSRNDVRMQRNIGALSHDWISNNRDASFLLRGGRLERYERWAKNTTMRLTADEADYIETSIAERERLFEMEQARQVREQELERRSLQRARLLAGVLFVGIVVAFGLSALAFNQSSLASDERDRAEAALATSDANALLSQSSAQGARALQALATGDSDLAIVLAMEANSIPNPSSESLQILAEAAFSPGTRKLLEAHTAFVVATDISPDQSLMASASSDGSVILWDVDTGEIVHRLLGHGGDVDAVAFSPDGRYVVSGAKDFIVILWDVETGAEIRRFTGHSDNVSDVAFSPDGDFILTGSKDTTLILWDVTTGEIIRTLEGHLSRVRDIAFSQDGTRALSTGRDGIWWNVETGEIVHRLEAESAIRSIALSPDNMFALSGSTGGELILWNLTNGAIVRDFESQTLEVETITFNPDGETVYLGLVDGSLKALDFETGDELFLLDGHNDAIAGVAISNDGSILSTASNDQTVRLWNIGNPGELLVSRAHESLIADLVLNSDASRVYTASADGRLRVWDTQSLELIDTLIESEEQLSTVAISGDDQVLIVGFRNGMVQLIDATTNSLAAPLILHEAWVESIDIHTETNRAVSGDQDGRIIVWDIATGEILEELQNTHGTVFSLRFMPSGDEIVWGSRDGTFSIWNLTENTMRAEVEAHEEAIYHIEVSPNGRQIATASRDTNVIIWDTITTEQTLQLSGHTGAVWTVIFSPNGRDLISGSADNTMIRWDVTTGAELQNYEADSVVYALDYASNEGIIYSGHASGTISQWKAFSVDELMSWSLENRYIRDLSCGEREFYSIEPFC